MMDGQTVLQSKLSAKTDFQNYQLQVRIDRVDQSPRQRDSQSSRIITVRKDNRITP